MAEVDSSKPYSFVQLEFFPTGNYQLMGTVLLVAAGALFCAVGLAKGAANGLQSSVVPLTR